MITFSVVAPGGRCARTTSLPLFRTLAQSTNNIISSTSWTPAIAEHSSTTTGSRLSPCPNALHHFLPRAPEPSASSTSPTIGNAWHDRRYNHKQRARHRRSWDSHRAVRLLVCITFRHHVPFQYSIYFLPSTLLSRTHCHLIVLSDPSLVSLFLHDFTFSLFTDSHVFKLEYRHAEIQLFPLANRPACPLATTTHSRRAAF